MVFVTDGDTVPLHLSSLVVFVVNALLCEYLDYI